MRDKFQIIKTVLFIAFIFFGCSEVEDKLNEPPVLEGVHGNGALDESSPEFHGKLVEDQGFESCQQCHAKSLDGGLTDVSCLDCHSVLQIHKEGILDPSSDNFHGKYLATQNWDVGSCKSCHGENYGGGLSNASCLDCHSGSGGPEACNTCHGSFADASLIAPPTDLDNNTETSEKGVGAHSTHLYDNDLTDTISCGDCHLENESISADYVASHINGRPAEVDFRTYSAMGPDLAEYNYSSLDCSNTYCHGNFIFYKEGSENDYAYSDSLIVGNNYNPIWNIVDGTQASCGTCHGEIDAEGNLITPKPMGHFGNFTIDLCVNCHSTTFNYYNSSDDFEFNTSNHINGEVNLN